MNTFLTIHNTVYLSCLCTVIPVSFFNLAKYPPHPFFIAMPILTHLLAYEIQTNQIISASTPSKLETGQLSKEYFCIP